jgi:hypothetical protein
LQKSSPIFFVFSILHTVKPMQTHQNISSVCGLCSKKKFHVTQHLLPLHVRNNLCLSHGQIKFFYPAQYNPLAVCYTTINH